MPDALMSLAGLLFCVGLLPTAFGSFRPPRATALMMAAGLTAILCAVGMLGLWVSMVVTAFQLALWVVVAVRGPGSGPEVKSVDTYIDRNESENYGFS